MTSSEPSVLLRTLQHESSNSNNMTIIPIKNDCLPIKYFMLNMRDHPDLTSYPGIQYFFVVLYSLVFLLGVFGNLCVIVAISRFRMLKTVRNIFIGSLSTSDMFVALFSLPASAYTLIYKNWVFGNFLCRTMPLAQGMGIVISSFTLMAIALDRHRLIVTPNKTPLSRNHAVVLNMLIWLTAAAVCLPASFQCRLIVHNHDENQDYCGAFCEEKWEDESHQKIYGSVILMIQFAIPLSTSALCYCRIISKLNHRFIVREAKKLGQSASTSQLKALKKTHRTNVMFSLMVLVFAGCWSLRNAINILNDFHILPQPITDQKYLAVLIAHWLAMTSTIWNPIMYGFMNGTFRAAFMELLPMLRLAYPERSFIEKRSTFWLREAMTTLNTNTAVMTKLIMLPNCDEEEDGVEMVVKEINSSTMPLLMGSVKKR